MVVWSLTDTLLILCVYVVYYFYNSYFGFTIMLRCLIIMILLPFRDVVSIIHSNSFMFYVIFFTPHSLLLFNNNCGVLIFLVSNNFGISIISPRWRLYCIDYFFFFVCFWNINRLNGLWCSAASILLRHYSKSSLRSSMMAVLSGSSDAAALLPYSLIFWMSKVNTWDGKVCWRTCESDKLETKLVT